MPIFDSPEDMDMIAWMTSQTCLPFHMDGLTIICTEKDRSNYMAWYQKVWAARLSGEKLERRRAQRRASEAKRREKKKNETNA